MYQTLSSAGRGYAIAEAEERVATQDYICSRASHPRTHLPHRQQSPSQVKPHKDRALARQFAVICLCEGAVLAAACKYFVSPVWIANFSYCGFGVLGWWRPSQYRKISYCSGQIAWLPLPLCYLEDRSFCCQKGTLLHCLQDCVHSASLDILFVYHLPVGLTSIPTVSL